VGNTGITSFGIGNYAAGTDNLHNLAIPISGVPGVRSSSPNAMGPQGRGGNFDFTDRRLSD
jgi:hypothetical protein